MKVFANTDFQEGLEGGGLKMEGGQKIANH